MEAHFSRVPGGVKELLAESGAVNFILTTDAFFNL
jgi:hypothetical protein